MLVICCVCRKTKNRNRWSKKVSGAGESLSHGYCPQCYQKMIDKVNAFFAQAEYRKSA